METPYQSDFNFILYDLGYWSGAFRSPPERRLEINKIPDRLIASVERLKTTAVGPQLSLSESILHNTYYIIQQYQRRVSRPLRDANSRLRLMQSSGEELVLKLQSCLKGSDGEAWWKLGYRCSQFELIMNRDIYADLADIKSEVQLCAHHLGLADELIGATINQCEAELTRRLEGASQASPFGVLKDAFNDVLLQASPSFWQHNPQGDSYVWGEQVTDAQYDVLVAIRRANGTALASDDLVEKSGVSSASRCLGQIRRHEKLQQLVNASGRVRWLDPSIPMP